MSRPAGWQLVRLIFPVAAERVNPVASKAVRLALRTLFPADNFEPTSLRMPDDWPGETHWGRGRLPTLRAGVPTPHNAITEGEG